MGSSDANSTSDSESNARKRVCKACDRCRLKKSKCDGSSPCSRCRVDNAICVFGERKKSHDKIYPKGYVEMLEQQQQQLVNGLRILYQRAVDSNNWAGPSLKAAPNGLPLTHDILERLDALKVEHGDEGEPFEEDLTVLQRRALAQEQRDLISSPSSSSSSFSSSNRLLTSGPPPAKRMCRQPSGLTKSESVIPLTHFPPTPPDQSPTEPTATSFEGATGGGTPFSPDHHHHHSILDSMPPLSSPHAWMSATNAADDIDADDLGFFDGMDPPPYEQLSLMDPIKTEAEMSMTAFSEDDLGAFGLASV